MHIIEYDEQYKNGIVALILDIQNNEAKVNIPLLYNLTYAIFQTHI